MAKHKAQADDQTGPSDNDRLADYNAALDAVIAGAIKINKEAGVGPQEAFGFAYNLYGDCGCCGIRAQPPYLPTGSEGV